MQRRTFDLLVSVGGMIVVIALVAAGFIFRANADFAQENVQSQLEAQNITFPPAAALSDEEKKQSGVVKYAGKQVVDGDMARVYANEFIGLHLKSIPNVNGRTYAELGTPQRELREKVTAAQTANDPALPGLQKQLDDITTARETVFKGETLRGLLLTTYAFWTLGEKAEQASWAFFGGAAALLALSILGFVHYARTPRKEVMFHAFTLKEKEKEQAQAERTGTNGEKRSARTR